MSIIQIVQDISKRITDITNNVEKIKTSQSSSKREIIDDLRNIKEKIEAMKKSCDEEKKNLEANIEQLLVREQRMTEDMNEEIVRMYPNRDTPSSKTPVTTRDRQAEALEKHIQRQQGKKPGNIANDAHKLTMHTASLAAEYGTGSRRKGGTKQKKKVRKKRTHKKFRG